MAGNGGNPLEVLIDDEEARLLHGVLADHPAELREMFALHYGQGLRYREIAQILGLNEAAVKQRFSRALRQLRVELESRNTKGGENDAIAVESGTRVEDVA